MAKKRVRWIVETIPSEHVRALATHIRALGLPEPVPEHRFHESRRWRFDLAWPTKKIAVECHGATFVGGRHVRGTGFEEDRRKMNAAQADGWRVFEFTGAMVRSGEAVDVLAEALAA